MKVYLRWIPVSAIALLLLFGAGCGLPSDAVVPTERVIAYAQPAVFLVEDFGDIKVSAPSGATTKKQFEFQETAPAPAASPSLLANQFDMDRRNGVIESETTLAEYGWEKITEDPGRYLNASEPETNTYEGVCYASGSAFAVSREGWLLTNAHVVSDPDHIPPSLSLIAGSIEKTVNDLSEELGAPPSLEIEKQAFRALARWFLQQTEVKGTFKEARIVLDTQHNEFRHLIETPLLNRGELADDLNKKLRDISVPVEIKAIGTVFPGEDVAVIKADLPNRLICLPLGDSDLVQPGTAVNAMGFPGSAIMEGAMTEDAGYRVITHEGQVDARLPMTGGWEGFHLTAEINHGDSGGPVLDATGHVIGLNVAGNQEQGPAQNIAIPINLAKKYLAQAGVKLDPGPVTQHWILGQQRFAAKDYRGALDEFEKVERLQNGRLGVSVFGSDASPYVQEMIGLCCKMGKIAPDTALGGLDMPSANP
ncbi:MAG TPA: serine protease [Chthonomonadaceae bacterium]|nr:serine protease [Chthonomonadaceae bacterium]